MHQRNKNWTCSDNRLLHQTRVFELYARRMKSPDGSYEDDFYYLKTVDWVNIIPITPTNDVVFVRQFRHGILEPSLEIPGGMLDDAKEDPSVAAVRELEEETGYRPGSIVPLGFVHPNPAIQDNRCYSYLALDVAATGKQNLDPAEDLSVELVPLSKIPKLIWERKITHTLVVSAFFRFFLYQQGGKLRGFGGNS